MKCKEILHILEQEVPLGAAKDWDNPGFLVGDKEREIKKILVVLDITNEVVEAAVRGEVDFILSHHPVIFSKIQRCTSDDFLQKKLLKLIQHGICCYGMHTNYDVYRMCDAVAKKLQFPAGEPVEEAEDVELKAKKKGIGIIGKLKETISLEKYARKVKDAFGLQAVTVYGPMETSIQTIAIVPGSGRSMIMDAAQKGADVLVTGDIGHHEGLDAIDMGMMVIDAGHYGLEHVFMEDMASIVKSKIPECQVSTYDGGCPYHTLC